MMKPGSGASPDQKASEISRDEIARRREDRSFVLVDVLPRIAFEGGHIPGAISIPLSEIAHSARQLLPDLDGEIAVYCGGGT